MRREIKNHKTYVMKACVLAFVLMSCVSAAAQGGAKVSGVVVEGDSVTAVGYASVALHDSATRNMVGGCATDGNGRFTISSVPDGTYYVECSFVGMKTTVSAPFSVKGGGAVDIGKVCMADGGNALGEVVVESRRPTFTAKLDRKVYNVGEDVAALTGSAGDVLQNIPSVDVDMDGNVSLRGNSNVTILINGKPSAMMGSRTRGDALNNLSAGTIERIEVITNPSAEYKPDGESGIINIVMKKGPKAGTNATVTAGAGSAGRVNVGADGGLRLGPVNLYGGYAYRRDRYDRKISDLRTSGEELVSQQTDGIGRPVSHTVRLGADADITVNDVLHADFSYNNRRFSRNEQMTSATVDGSGVQNIAYRRTRDALAKENMYEAGLQYTHTYGNGREWSASYQYSSESEDENNDYLTSRQSGDVSDRQHVWDANYLHTAGLRVAHRLTPALALNAGCELEFLRAEQGYHAFIQDGTGYVPDPDNSSDFAHLRRIYSLYATLEASLGQWSVLAGLRGERVSQDNKLISESTSSHRNYAGIYPTLHVSRKVGTRNELSLSYSLRVNRPEGSDMNPFAERINPLSLQAGNPDLRPEKIHSIEAGWQWRGDALSLLTTVYYRYLTDQITEVSRYIDNGVLLTTKENLNSSQNAGAEAVLGGQATRWLAFNCNLNGYYNRIDATALGYGRSKGTFSWSALANVDITPFRHCMVQLNARYHSSTLVPQGRRDADSRIDLGVRYDIPVCNLSVTATVTDLLDTYGRSYTLDTPDLKQKMEQRRNPRIFAVGLLWRLGSNPAKKHSADIHYDETF